MDKNHAPVEDKLAQRLAVILKDDVPTKKEFIDAFSTVIDYVKKIDTKLAGDFSNLARTLNTVLEQIKTGHTSSLQDLKKQVNDVFVGDRLTQMEGDLHGKVDTKLKGVDERMKTIRSGRDANPADVVPHVLKKIRQPKDGSPDTPTEVRNKLEALDGDNRLDVTAIKGLEETVKKMTRGQGGSTASVSGRDIFSDIDISAQLNGVTKTFNIHAVYNIISVHLSSFPNALRKTVDFTYTPTSITFTSQIDAATSLAAGQTCVLTVVNA